MIEELPLLLMSRLMPYYGELEMMITLLSIVLLIVLTQLPKPISTNT